MEQITNTGGTSALSFDFSTLSLTISGSNELVHPTGDRTSYDITLRLCYISDPSCSSFVLSYTNLVEYCGSNTLIINSAKFANPAETYEISAPNTTSFSWSDSDVSVSSAYTDCIACDCGGYTWQIFKSDGVSPIDSLIYTLGDLTATSKTIDILTDDISLAGDADSQNL